MLQASGLVDGLVVSWVSVVECICITSGSIKFPFTDELLDSRVGDKQCGKENVLVFRSRSDTLVFSHCSPLGDGR